MKVATKTTEKIVGTTFRNIDINQFPLNNDEIPKGTFEGHIYPEVNNAHDSNAKLVELFLPTGDTTKIIPIGYLKKDGPLYKQSKSHTKTPIKCKVVVMAYSVNGAYDSYRVIVE